MDLDRAQHETAVQPGSGEVGRIWAQFRGEKKRIDYSNDGLPSLYLRMARQWRRPVREIKRIVRMKRVA